MDVEVTQEKVINHVQDANDSFTFLLFSQHPKWVILLVN